VAGGAPSSELRTVPEPVVVLDSGSPDPASLAVAAVELLWSGVGVGVGVPNVPMGSGCGVVMRRVTWTSGVIRVLYKDTNTECVADI